MKYNKKGHWVAYCTVKRCSGCNGRECAADLRPIMKEKAVMAMAKEVRTRDDDREDGAF